MIRKTSLVRIILSFSVAIALVTYLWFLSTEPVEKSLLPPDSKTAKKPVPNFSKIKQVKEKKQRFFSYLKPEVVKQNQHILGIRHQLQMFQRKIQRNEPLAEKSKEKIRWLAEEYRVDTADKVGNEAISEQLITALLHKVDVIPVELVLVQAANESAWGTSRFARKGYNFFGLWCFVKGCGFVPTQRASDLNHEVAKFDNLTAAVYTYIRNLNRHEAYSELRDIRASLRANQAPISGSALAEGLISYSERGHDYVDEIQAMIRVNNEYFSE